MKLTLLALFCSVAALHAEGTTWKLDATGDMSAWRSFGTVSGQTMGPSAGDYAISGIASHEPVVKGAGTEFTVKVAGFKVTQAAPNEAENGNDLRLNIVLSPKAEDAYGNDDAVIDVVLSYNSENGGIYASLQFKEGKKPSTGTTQLAGEYLGNDLQSIDVVLKLKPDSISVDFRRDGGLLRELSTAKSPALTEMLKHKLNAVIYQQNIRDSQGTVSVAEIGSVGASKP